MIVKCYAVLDSKVSDFHLAIFDLKHEGAMRQFSDAVNDKQTKWNRHPEDYSLWYVGDFDTSKGALQGALPENLVNGSAVVTLRNSQLELDLYKGGEVEKEKAVS